MGEEMQRVEGDTGWRKAIPEKRDWLQSRVLVWVVGVLLALETVGVMQQGYFIWGEQGAREHMLPVEIIGISVAFACLVLSLRAATVAGALFGGMISFTLLMEPLPLNTRSFDLDWPLWRYSSR